MKLKFYFIIFLFAIVACKKEKEVNDDDLPTPKPNIEALSDGDFENWETISHGNASYEEPISGWWTSLNMLSVLGGPITLNKSTDAYSGNYSAKLETKKWGDDFIIPGLLAAGYFDPTASIGRNVIQGKPFTQKPLSIKGYYKFLSVDNDSAGIYAALSRYNTTTNKRDTIAIAKQAIYNTIINWELFDIAFEYKISDLIPDTIFVVFTSSLAGSQFIGNEGSTLWVDNVALNFNP